WTDALLARAKTVISLLERDIASLPDPAKGSALVLQNHREAILKSIEASRTAQYDAVKIRHHGDFHLGQVLIVKDDAYLLDFEGEPRRSLEDRRRKAPAARDVAGFARSIDYATSAALEREANLGAEERAALAARMRQWTDHLIEAYWQSYREALGDERLWPRDVEKSRQLFDFFCLEKAFYEVEYELANRPGWVNIPLEATLRLLCQRGAVPP